VTTFALIHGGFHGGWCWDLLTPELEARGHRVVAPDLPITDPSCGNREYAAVVVAALERADDDVIVVGHSQGGTTVPYVAVRRPVRKLVYLAAAVPTPGESFAEYLAAHPAFLRLPAGDVFDEWGCMTVTNDVARTTFFDDCPQTVANWAVSRLRHQATTPVAELCRLASTTEWPAEYIRCLDDRALDPDGCARLAKDRLGLTARELSGGHSPFLTRPAELASLLDDFS
jgi:pimeloyl-ACP methyl ester carboxylesterase